MLKKFFQVLCILSLLSHAACKSQQSGGGGSGDGGGGDGPRGQGGQPVASKQNGSVTEEGLEDARAGQEAAPAGIQTPGPGLNSNNGLATNEFGSALLNPNGLNNNNPALGQFGGPTPQGNPDTSAPGIPRDGAGIATGESASTADSHAENDPPVVDSTPRSRPVADGTPIRRVGKDGAAKSETVENSETSEAPAERAPASPTSNPLVDLLRALTQEPSSTPSETSSSETPRVEAPRSDVSSTSESTLPEFNVPDDGAWIVEDETKTPAESSTATE